MKKIRKIISQSSFIYQYLFKNTDIYLQLEFYYISNLVKMFGLLYKNCEFNIPIVQFKYIDYLFLNNNFGK